MIEVKHTKGRHIPDLKEKKLRVLYRYSRKIKKQGDIAKALKVSAATVVVWLSGTRCDDGVVLNPNSIPDQYFGKFKEIWGLPLTERVLDADVVELESALASLDDAAIVKTSTWDELVRALPDDPSIEIVADPQTTKGIFPTPEEAESGLPHFSAGDYVMLRVPNPDPGLHHAAMLLQDRRGWSRLLPNTRWPNTEVDKMLVYPHPQGTSPFAQLDDVGGVHRVLAVFSAEPFPDDVREVLMSEPIDVGGLNHAATVFGHRANDPVQHRMLSRRFVVRAKR